jgi:hypothetical protein
MAIGGKRNADNARMLGSECFRRKAMAGNGAWPIALQKNIGPRGQIMQSRAIIRRAQIKCGASFAAPGIHHQFIKARQMCRADMQNISAMRGECAARHRPGNHARQVKHAHPGKRSRGSGRQGNGRRIADFLDQ